MSEEDTLWEDGTSVFRPSYSDTWLNCEGSLRPSMVADDTAGYDAAVGTVFHEIMKEWQLNGRPDQWAGQVWEIEKTDKYGRLVETFKIEIDEDMFIYGQECLDYVKDIPGRIYVEIRVDISSITPIAGQGGTADRIACDWQVLDITDWKYGRGVQVFAPRNTQLLLYAAGAYTEWDWLYDFQTIRLRIAQPRLRHFEMWEISREELLAFIEEAKGKAYRAWKRKAPRSPSPKACQWCKVRTDCAALEAARQALIDDTPGMFDEPMTNQVMQKAGQKLMEVRTRVLPGPETLTTSQLLRVYPWRKLMESWFKQIGEELVRRSLNDGEDLEGMFKVVKGRTRRQYKDENEAIDTFRRLGLLDDDIFIRKVASPNQLKPKLREIGIRGKLQDDFIKTLVRFPPGRPTLVPIGDMRSEIPSINDVFEDDE